MTTARPLVSILTPSYNQGRFLRDTIESVVRQDYPRVEHIVVDGGSTDETSSILKEYGDRIVYVSEPDGGQADALNKAFALAEGSIIGWLNSDDFYIWDGVISAVVEAFERPGADVDVVYGHAIWVDHSNRIVKVYPRPRFSRQRLERFDYISQPAAFVRRECLQGRLVDASLRYALDYQLWLHLLGKGCRFARLDDYLAAMRYHRDAKSVRARVNMWREDAAVPRVTSRPGTISEALGDLSIMVALKLRGLAAYHRRALHSARWCIPLTLPVSAVRPLYQAGFIGSSGSFLLLPRYLLWSRKQARAD